MDQPKQIPVKATDDDLKGRYANLMQVSHNPDEFVMDFLSLFPSGGQLISRIITSPGHMKRISIALVQNIKNYESKFGEIKSSEEPTQGIGFKAD
jgi:hypothetical protein